VEKKETRLADAASQAKLGSKPSWIGLVLSLRVRDCDHIWAAAGPTTSELLLCWPTSKAPDFFALHVLSSQWFFTFLSRIPPPSPSSLAAFSPLSLPPLSPSTFKNFSKQANKPSSSPRKITISVGKYRRSSTLPRHSISRRFFSSPYFFLWKRFQVVLLLLSEAKKREKLINFNPILPCRNTWMYNLVKVKSENIYGKTERYFVQEMRNSGIVWQFWKLLSNMSCERRRGGVEIYEQRTSVEENGSIDQNLLIDPKLLFIGNKIGEGAHGEVYKGRLVLLMTAETWFFFFKFL